jgi:hypothetical protein
MLLKLVYRGMRLLSPQLASVIRDTYFTVNGWRFQDLKDHVDLKIGSDTTNTISMDRSLREILDGTLDPERIAFITNLPPDDTGIAICSYFSLLGHQGPIDVFCPVADTDWFFANALQLGAASKGSMRILDVNAFLTADQMNHYKAVVISTGNSNHCIYIHDVLKKAASLGDLSRFIVYLHDPCILNFVQRGGRLTPSEMVGSFEAIYERKIPITPSDLASSDAVRATLAEQGLMGVRFLLNSGVKRYIVNSRAALDLVTTDLASEAAQVTQLFHPAFLPRGGEDALSIARARVLAGRSEQFTIGTFGVPGPSKLTHRVAAAAREIGRRGVPVRVLMAGYGVREYLRNHGRDFDGLDLRSFDGPTDPQLLRCMAETDVAVQFRSKNLGESSGIVPQLLCLGKTVLVSDIGSFKEFGNAVRMVSNDLDVENLADEILHLWHNPIFQKHTSDYVSRHTPARFREKLIEIVATS